MLLEAIEAIGIFMFLSIIVIAL